MSKERQRRREERQREAAIKAAARAAEAERRDRREQRRRALRRLLPAPSGRPTGTLAARRRTEWWLLITALVAVQAIVWVVRPDWEARLAALIVSVLAAPVLATFLFRHRL